MPLKGPWMHHYVVDMKEKKYTMQTRSCNDLGTKCRLSKLIQTNYLNKIGHNARTSK